MRLKVNEIFYAAMQGEGIYTGVPSVFLRLQGCNYRCPWCDTIYAYNEGEEMTLYDVAKNIKRYPTNRLVITGGEPLLQKGLIVALLRRLLSWHVTIETNGSIHPGGILVNLWSVSPKMSNAGYTPDPKILRYFTDWDNQFKFVIGNNKTDVPEVLTFLKENLLYPKVLIFQPMTEEGLSVDTYLNRVRNLAEEIKWMVLPYKEVRVLPQMHWLLYGRQRGK